MRGKVLLDRLIEARGDIGVPDDDFPDRPRVATNGHVSGSQPSDEEEFAGLNYFANEYPSLFFTRIMEKDHLPNSLACNVQASRLCQGCQTRNLGENKSPPETLESLQPIAPLQISSAAESTTASMLDLDDNSH